MALLSITPCDEWAQSTIHLSFNEELHKHVVKKTGLLSVYYLISPLTPTPVYTSYS